MTHASAFSEVFVPICDLSLVCAILVGLVLAMRGAGVATSERRRVFLSAAAGAAIWCGAVSYFAARGAFAAAPDVRFPLLPIAVASPVILGLAVLPRSPLAARLLDATPLSRLVGVQVLRVLGVVFLIEWALGSLPAVFALPAALGDIATGLLAIPVARLASRRSPRAPAAAILWTALGLADFVAALATGFLSSPGRLQILALDHPNHIGSAYPLVMIPAFGVPVFILLHATALWKLRREGLRSHSPNLIPRTA